jgi:outer membrane protein assembly factor BamE
MNTIFRPYVPDVVQGNFISSEQYAKLKLGMTREQVRQVLGTPLLASYFHANRWDYVFEFKRAGQRIGDERNVTVFFEGDKVVKFDGTPLPTEVEMVAEIDNYAKQKRSFWEIFTGNNKPPVTKPLQQPELLVPSPTNNAAPEPKPVDIPVPKAADIATPTTNLVTESAGSSQPAPLTPPLQQPEILLPSPINSAPPEPKVAKTPASQATDVATPTTNLVTESAGSSQPAPLKTQ